ncbi:hypothetical protein JL721_8847 [Aureococcus anophagefferens]|nr:hypothetical protein JL721_8847 [Aureococcus anophagefferens]
MELVGDEAKWDAIFASREAELVASGFQWPEGPRWTKSKGLLFSDTISGKMYRWDEATKSAVVFLDDAGGCPKANLEGCADGFVYHAWFHVLLASCPGGLCVVGLDEGAVIAKLRFGGSVANVELGGGYAWITGNGGLYRIKLNDEKPADVVKPFAESLRAGPRQARTSAAPPPVGGA